MKRLFRYIILAIVAVITAAPAAMAQNKNVARTWQKESFIVMYDDSLSNTVQEAGEWLITFSDVDTMGNKFREPVMMHIESTAYTDSSITSFSIESIDSLLFEKPDAVLTSGVFEITKEHFDYIVKTDTLTTIYFRIDCVTKIDLPQIGQKVICNLMYGYLPYGFLGLVEEMNISYDDGWIEMVCSPLQLSDVYDKLYISGSNVAMAVDTTQVQVGGSRRLLMRRMKQQEGSGGPIIIKPKIKGFAGNWRITSKGRVKGEFGVDGWEKEDVKKPIYDDGTGEMVGVENTEGTTIEDNSLNMPEADNSPNDKDETDVISLTVNVEPTFCVYYDCVIDKTINKDFTKVYIEFGANGGIDASLTMPSLIDKSADFSITFPIPILPGLFFLGEVGMKAEMQATANFKMGTTLDEGVRFGLEINNGDPSPILQRTGKGNVFKNLYSNTNVDISLNGDFSVGPFASLGLGVGGKILTLNASLNPCFELSSKLSLNMQKNSDDTDITTKFLDERSKVYKELAKDNFLSVNAGIKLDGEIGIAGDLVTYALSDFLSNFNISPSLMANLYSAYGQPQVAGISDIKFVDNKFSGKLSFSSDGLFDTPIEMRIKDTRLLDSNGVKADVIPLGTIDYFEGKGLSCPFEIDMSDGKKYKGVPWGFYPVLSSPFVGYTTSGLAHEFYIPYKVTQSSAEDGYDFVTFKGEFDPDGEGNEYLSCGFMYAPAGKDVKSGEIIVADQYQSSFTTELDAETYQATYPDDTNFKGKMIAFTYDVSTAQYTYGSEKEFRFKTAYEPQTDEPDNIRATQARLWATIHDDLMTIIKNGVSDASQLPYLGFRVSINGGAAQDIEVPANSLQLLLNRYDYTITGLEPGKSVTYQAYCRIGTARYSGDSKTFVTREPMFDMLPEMECGEAIFMMDIDATLFEDRTNFYFEVTSREGGFESSGGNAMQAPRKAPQGDEVQTFTPAEGDYFYNEEEDTYSIVMNPGVSFTPQIPHFVRGVLETTNYGRYLSKQSTFTVPNPVKNVDIVVRASFVKFTVKVNSEFAQEGTKVVFKCSTNAKQDWSQITADKHGYAEVTTFTKEGDNAVAIGTISTGYISKTYYRAEFIDKNGQVYASETMSYDPVVGYFYDVKIEPSARSAQFQASVDPAIFDDYYETGFSIRFSTEPCKSKDPVIEDEWFENSIVVSWSNETNQHNVHYNGEEAKQYIENFKLTPAADYDQLGSISFTIKGLKHSSTYDCDIYGELYDGEDWSMYNSTTSFNTQKLQNPISKVDITPRTTRLEFKVQLDKTFDYSDAKLVFKSSKKADQDWSQITAGSSNYLEVTEIDTKNFVVKAALPTNDIWSTLYYRVELVDNTNYSFISDGTATCPAGYFFDVKIEPDGNSAKFSAKVDPIKYDIENFFTGFSIRISTQYIDGESPYEDNSDAWFNNSTVIECWCDLEEDYRAYVNSTQKNSVIKNFKHHIASSYDEDGTISFEVTGLDYGTHYYCDIYGHVDDAVVDWSMYNNTIEFDTRKLDFRATTGSAQPDGNTATLNGAVTKDLQAILVEKAESDNDWDYKLCFELSSSKDMTYPAQAFVTMDKSKTAYATTFKNLQYGQTYYYRFVAFSDIADADAKVYYGEVKDFKTGYKDHSSLSVSTLNADIDDEKTTLWGKLNSDAISAYDKQDMGMMYIGFEYAPTRAGLDDQSVVLRETDVDFDSGTGLFDKLMLLEPTTTYYYRAYININGEFIYAEPVEFTTAEYDPGLIIPKSRRQVILRQLYQAHRGTPKAKIYQRRLMELDRTITNSDIKVLKLD